MSGLEAIDYALDGTTYTGFLADGSNGRRVPGVLVAHEGGGLTDHVKQVALRLAGLGYVAFALDLFAMPEFDMERARAVVAQLRADVPMLRRRMTAAFDVLRTRPEVDPTRIAAVGYCFGGTAALELARGGAELSAVVGLHAGLTTSPETSAIRCPVLLCLGDADPVVTAEQRDAFLAEARSARLDWQLHLYGGVGHSFTNREIDAWALPGFAFDAIAERRSWMAMTSLLADVFGRAASPSNGLAQC